jgi:predicted neuraminidase
MVGIPTGRRSSFCIFSNESTFWTGWEVISFKRVTLQKDAAVESSLFAGLGAVWGPFQESQGFFTLPDDESLGAMHPALFKRRQYLLVFLVGSFGPLGGQFKNQPCLN